MTCPICQEDMEGTETIKLDCGHVFHPKCIIDWFRSAHSQCPLCRAEPLHQLRCMDVLTRASLLRQMARRKGAPDRLVRAVKQLKDAEDMYKETLGKLKEVKEHEAVKTYKRLMAQRSRQHWTVRKKKSKLGMMTGKDIPCMKLEIVREAVDVISFELE